MTDTALPPEDAPGVKPASDKPAAKKAATKKAAAPDQGQATREGASARVRPPEVLKYAYTLDDDGNITSLAACGSNDTLFEYCKANPGKAFRFIDGPKGADIVADIRAAV